MFQRTVFSFCSLAFAVALSGCSELGGGVEYVSLESSPADFDPHANPAFRYSERNDETVEDPRPAVEDVRPVVELPNRESTGAVDSPQEDGGVGESATEASEDSRPVETGGRADPRGPSEPREIKLLVPEKRFRTEQGSTIRVSYDDIDLLKVLNMEPVPVDATDYFPNWLAQLEGRRIRIRGFMYPTFEATGLKGFTLARDNGICCFVRQPMIYDIIGVDLAEGTTTDYIDNKPFDVEGVFRIVPEADDTELFQLYRISDAKVLN